MVAYSFKSAFVEDIAAYRKLQTIRLPRRRHARPGEDIQIFQAMRTKLCRKIIPDPRCIGVDHLVLDLRTPRLERIEINGVLIDVESPDADAFAVADGFGRPPEGLRPIGFFHAWWRLHHGSKLFEDLVLVRWSPQAAGAPS